MLKRAPVLAILIILLSQHALQADLAKYVVVSFVKKGDAIEKAGKRLLKLRDGRGIRASPDDLNSLLPKLKRCQPEYVAFVARPDQIDVNFARQVLKLATRVDDDPFVDFSYGVITGHTADDAIRLVESGSRVTSRNPDLGILGVADSAVLKESQNREQAISLRGLTVPMSWATIVNDGGDKDHVFMDRILDQFKVKTLFTLAGHGFPNGIVGGPKRGDLTGRRFDGTVVYNVACYTGVTSGWYQTDFQNSKVRRFQIQPEESFCLGMLRTGVAAYVAYTCPRPAGPEMFADMISLASEGISVGEQRRRHANSVILTHLGQDDSPHNGFDKLRDGESIPIRRTTDQIVRSMSTGCLLFGDPAVTPFRETVGAYPVRCNVTTKTANELSVEVAVSGSLWHWFCADQLEQSNMKIEARIPFHGEGIKSVIVEKLPFGEKHVATKVVAATETHGKKSFLHVKAAFERPSQAELVRYLHGVRARFIVELDTEKNADHYLHLRTEGSDNLTQSS